jgi:hypothetical protein
MHAWSKKAIGMMEAAQQQTDDPTIKKGTRKKNLPARVPEEEFRDAIQLTADGKPGIPAVMIKKAMVEACKHIDGIPSTVAMSSITVIGDVLPIEASEAVMRTDMVKIGPWSNRVATPRYRPEYAEWSCVVHIRYWADKLSADHVVNLLSIAGFTNGLGEWRQQKGGNYGAFHVEATKDNNG